MPDVPPTEQTSAELVARRLRWQVRGFLPAPPLDDGSEAAEPRARALTAPGPLFDLDVDEVLAAEIAAVDERHDVSAPTWPGRGLRSLAACIARRVVTRLLLPVLAQQSEVNAATARSLAHLRDRSAQLRDRSAQLGDLAGAQQAALADAETRHGRDLDEIRRMMRSEARMLARLQARDQPVPIDYYDLTEQFRGPEGQIAERQRPYLQLLQGAAPVVDLGCGRGEFLELLREARIEARGVDTSAAMVDRCREKGLDASRRDAVDYLRQLEPESLGGAFSAQLIEHLHTHAVVELVRVAHRMLRVGGILILEAPNPGSLHVLTDFTLDPSHVRLHHPEFMKWLLAHEGFEDARLIYTLPEPESEEQLRDPLDAPQAFAVVGRRATRRASTGSARR